MPKYRVIWFGPGLPEAGRSLGTMFGNSDEEIVAEIREALSAEPGWSAQIWRPDRKSLVAALPAQKSEI